MFFKYSLAVLLLLHFSFAQPVPDSSSESLVVVSDNKNTEGTNEKAAPPELRSMNVVANIRNRYVKTAVISKYVNPAESAQETTFSIILPDTAFISGFVMEIKGKKYEAYVREKEEAKKEYQQAVAQGLGAAHVAVSARDSNKFTVSVNVEPQSKVIFNLTYEELLVRKHGKYELVVNLHPGQLIKDLKVDVNINETRPIINVEIPALRSGNEIVDKHTNNDYAVIDRDDDGVVHVKFDPTVDQQKQMTKLLNVTEDKGIAGQFVVNYDVERDPQGGEVLVNDGYFVHFFSPNDLKPIPKHVVFVLDVSGSMYGRKIEQLKEAMEIILGELNSDDYFNLVKFHTNIQVLNSTNEWENIEVPKESELPEAFKASAENIERTKNVVKDMHDEGLTNIYDALIVGLRLTSRGVPKSENAEKHQPIIVFLTDGQANVGESTPEKMIEMVKERNKNNKAAVFTLAFGDDANKEFLKELGLKNSGFLRNIYEAADASLQLQDFYKEISSPLLKDVTFKYSNDVKDVTKHKFDILFKGTEFVVSGKIDNPEKDAKLVTVEGLTKDGLISFRPTIIPLPPKPKQKEEYGSLERLWAYLTIKQLLDKKYETEKLNTTNDTETPEKQALKIALKYSFVTPLTSLVVVKPNDTDAVPLAATKPASEDRPYFLNKVAYSSPIGHMGPPGFPGFPAPVYAKLPSYPVLHGAVPASAGLPLSTFPSTTLNYHSLTLPQTSIAEDSFVPESDLLAAEPLWLLQSIHNGGKIDIHNKQYEIGNNGTVVQQQPCEVKSLNISGNCTLINACPKLFPQLITIQDYETYFCSLESDRYAGVCCPEYKEP